MFDQETCFCFVGIQLIKYSFRNFWHWCCSACQVGMQNTFLHSGKWYLSVCFWMSIRTVIFSYRKFIRNKIDTQKKNRYLVTWFWAPGDMILSPFSSSTLNQAYIWLWSLHEYLQLLLFIYILPLLHEDGYSSLWTYIFPWVNSKKDQVSLPSCSCA